MKRIVTAILALLIMTRLTACGDTGKPDTSGDDPADIAQDIATAEVLGDTLAAAYANGVGAAEDWLDLYFMGTSGDDPDKRAEVEAQHPTNDELLYGIDAASADAAGWYDIWYAVHYDLWSFSNDGYEDYGNYAGDAGNTGTISEERVRQINWGTVISLAHDWKNENNKSLPNGAKVTNTNVRLTDYRYSGSVVTAVTEVEYWFSGGSSDGSVYATVVIDLYTGDVLSASIG